MGLGLAMTTTDRLRASAAIGFGAPAKLRPADSAHRPQATVSAGPFGVSPPGDTTPVSASALLTAMMIVYPAFATVAAIAIGLLLSGTSA